MTAPEPAARIPLNTLAIPFGLAGLAEAWGAAGNALHWPRAVAQVWWAIAAVAWLGLIVAHLRRGARTGLPLRLQLRHPAQGPIAALVPVTAMLLGADLAGYALPAARVVVAAANVAAAVFGAWLIATWFEGGLRLEAVHGGYLLPTVAAGLVGADAAARIGYSGLAWALFAVGGFFWAIMMTLLVLRLTIRPALQAPLAPTMAILAAPPAVAGLAWFELQGVRPDPVAAGLAGLAVMLTLVQFALLPRYRALPFSLGFWSFTFPAAAVVADALMWVRAVDPPGRSVLVVALLALITALVGSIAVRSLALLIGPAIERAENTLTQADDADAVRPRPERHSHADT
ncbi:hypothetical protein [Actinoplanes subtropicus]|uniref:SLAC1 family transporter n=1 Tax=Actinoplanes subtropicus TaxID=543632 RepID=UPI0004C3C150|nr:hypothetical protein [Actinoplanes subtropicus]